MPHSSTEQATRWRSCFEATTGTVLSRPYFHHSTNELNEIFQKCKGDTGTLRSLLAELKHRSRPKGQELKQKVEEALGNSVDTVQRQSRQSKAPPTGPLSDPKQNTLFDDSPDASSIRPSRAAPSRNRKKLPVRAEDQTAKPSQYTLVEPMGAQGRPDKFTFTLKTDVRLAADSNTPYAKAYAEVIGAYVDELKREGTAVQRLLLQDGVRLDLDSGIIGYSFPFSGEADLFEGATVTIEHGGKRTEGEIASLLPGKLILRSTIDFGQYISSCVMKVDNTALLVLLQKRLDEVANGLVQDFNQVLADAVFANHSQSAPIEVPGLDQLLNNLNRQQREAVVKSLACTVTYLWGPPGTGKTQTLTTLVRALYDAGKRVLICSNTNRAVDQVLLKLCKGWKTDEGGPLDLGHVLRIGLIQSEELKDKYHDFVSLDGVVQRRSAELFDEKTKLEQLLNAAEHNLEPLRQFANAFERLDELQRSETASKAEIRRLSTTLETNVKKCQRQQQRAEQFAQELDKQQNMGTIRRMFGRSEDTINRDIELARQAMAKCDAENTRTEGNLEQQRDSLVSIRDSVTTLIQELREVDRKATLSQIEVMVSERRQFLSRLQEINGQIEEIEKTVLANTRVLGATITKTFIKYNDLRLFDAVIVDEASMALLPSVYFVAGRATERCVICGDFRQLPPIVQSKQEVIQGWIGNDLFQHAGVVDQIEKGQLPNNLSILNEQWRMDDSVCSLISELYYRGELITSPQRIQSSARVVTDLFTKPLVIVDTSRLWPFCGRDVFGSRYNLMHALLARNICQYLQNKGLVTDETHLGVCTPYKAQARLTQSVIKSFDSSQRISASTVHHFQGDEKQIILLDVPDSIGEWAAGIFLQATDLADAGAKLFNVAVSRAKEQLIVLANLTYLDGKLPGTALLRGLLYDIQNRGSIVDAADVLALYPIDSDLREYIRGLDVNWDATRTGLFATNEFTTGFLHDIEHAKKHIVIFSGFITPQRTATYDAIFRRKTAEGVKIRCVTRPPNRNGTMPEKDGIAALRALESIGAVVDLRSQIHEKVVIVDDQIAWFGSLNPLSHTSSTDELMARVVGRDAVGQIATFLCTGRTDPEQMLAGKVAEKEYPNCPRCESWLVFNRGRYGPYLACSDSSCDWKGNADAPINNDEDVCDAPTCPSCEIKMKVRRGRHGKFFGCTNYPKCKETVQMAK